MDTLFARLRQWWRCKRGYHRLIVTRIYSPYVRVCFCTACGHYFGMNDMVEAFIPWTWELRVATEIAYGPGEDVSI